MLCHMCCGTASCFLIKIGITGLVSLPRGLLREDLTFS